MHDGVRPTIDLCDPEFYRSAGMHDAFTWMRANEPVYRDEANELWAVTHTPTSSTSNGDPVSSSPAGGTDATGSRPRTT